MNPALSGFFGGVWQWVIDVWDTGNWWVRVALILIVGFPLVQLVLLLNGVTVGMGTIAIVVLCLIAYILIWKFRYPALYILIEMTDGGKFWRNFFFLLGANMALAVGISFIGMVIAMRDHQPVTDQVLLTAIVLAIIVMFLLSRVFFLKEDLIKNAKALYGKMKWVIGFSLFLLLFPQVREAAGDGFSSLGDWMARLLRWGKTEQPVSAAGIGSSAGVPEEHVGDLARVDGARPGMYLPAARETTVVLTSDSVVTTTIGLDTLHYLEVESPVSFEVVVKTKSGDDYRDRVTGARGFYSLAMLKQAEQTQPLRLKRLTGDTNPVRVSVWVHKK
ncbi:MAG: hypothetical protein Q7S84_04125 [bacterium]|nr:hypothetical protein [bacterium]